MASVAAVQRSRLEGISKRNFDRLSRYIYSYSGIRMPETKSTMLEGRLRRRLRVTGHTVIDDYCDFLFEEGGIESEAVHLIDAVTTNKTDFFREPKHFSFLEEVVVPGLMERGQRDVRLWSSACSTGAEPYTLAMVMEAFAKSGALSYSILATDLSTDVLATAQRAVYPAEMVAPVPDHMSKHIMRARRTDQDVVRIHPRLRAKVGFARMNLMDERYQVGEPMDVIFCRNVLIYFDKQTQTKVLSRLCDCLVQGGHLFIGHSESIMGMRLPVRQVSNTIFQRV